MKHSIIILIAVFLTAGCRKTEEINKNTLLIPDISDLKMTADMQKIYSERRRKLMEQIENGLIVLRSDYTFDGGRYEYRAANNFYYLTGFAEPGSVIVLTREGNYPFRLYLKERTIKETIYNGKLPATDSILVAYKPDTVIMYNDPEKIFKDNIQAGTPVFLDFEDSSLKKNINSIIKPGTSVSFIKDVAPFINEMRVYKDESEIARLQKAVNITGEAFINACSVCRPGLYEFEIEAMIEYTFRKFGSPMPAFTSIVASGPNATILHYSMNTRKMKDGDLLLIDIGAEYGYYSADVSRTIPVNGKFTREQKDIYELVLKAQKTAISEMKQGNFLIAGHNKSNEVIIHGLYNLGLITDPESDWQREFYILHWVSHYLGMYVHDVGDYGAPDTVIAKTMTKDTLYGRILEAGMVLTAEPGLYFRSDGMSRLFELFGGKVAHEEIQDFIDKVSPVYEKYKGIGVRIEDDVLIKDKGNMVLSGSIPKEISDIEILMSKRKRNRW